MVVTEKNANSAIQMVFRPRAFCASAVVGSQYWNMSLIKMPLIILTENLIRFVTNVDFVVLNMGPYMTLRQEVHGS